jgi:hypothetical protein
MTAGVRELVIVAGPNVVTAAAAAHSPAYASGGSALDAGGGLV